MTKYFQKVYTQGQEAARNGWEKVSPYHNCKAESVWYEGYESVTK